MSRRFAGFGDAAKTHQLNAQLRGELRLERRENAHLHQLLGQLLPLMVLFADSLDERLPELDELLAHASDQLVGV